MRFSFLIFIILYSNSVYSQLGDTIEVYYPENFEINTTYTAEVKVNNYDPWDSPLDSVKSLDKYYSQVIRLTPIGNGQIKYEIDITVYNPIGFSSAPLSGIVSFVGNSAYEAYHTNTKIEDWYYCTDDQLLTIILTDKEQLSVRLEIVHLVNNIMYLEKQ